MSFFQYLKTASPPPLVSGGITLMLMGGEKLGFSLVGLGIIAFVLFFEDQQKLIQGT